MPRLQYGQDCPKTCRILLILFVLAAAQTPLHAAEQEPIVTLPALQVRQLLETLRSANQSQIACDTSTDWQFVERLAAGQPTPHDWAAASLIASGETDPIRRKALLDRLDQLTVVLQKTCRGKTDLERGELLLKELHKTLLKEGYDLEQSSVAEVFDSGKYNCVSSSVLYYLLAKRLGLTVRGLEIPGSSWSDGHVLVQLHVGEQKIDVETTNPDGFDCRGKVARTGATAWGLQDLADARVIDEIGLLQSLYNNRSVAAAKAGRHFDSLQLRLLMYALATQNHDMQAGLAGGFVNWTVDLIEKQHDYAQALAVGRCGLQIAPTHRPLIQNVKFGCERAAQAYIADQKDAAVVELFQQAQRDWPKLEFEQELSRAFQLAAQSARDQTGWKTAIAVLDRGWQVADEANRAALSESRSDYYRMWSQSELEAGRYTVSAQVLATALTQFPNDKNIAAGVEFLVQESLPAVAAKSGTAAVLELHQQLQQQFPHLDNLPEISASFVGRSIEQPLAAKDWALAHKTVANYRTILTAAQQAELAGYIFECQADEQEALREWQKAQTIYQAGLKEWPACERLRQRAVGMFDRWAEEPWSKQDWAAAKKIYEFGLQDFPDNRDLQSYRDLCVERLKSQ